MHLKNYNVCSLRIKFKSTTKARFFAAWFVFYAFSSTSMAADPLEKGESEYLFWSLMSECFSAYRQEIGEHISNLQIINMCECASRQTVKNFTKRDLYQKNTKASREKIINLMQRYGGVCAKDQFFAN
jgi:hypothetical protein